MIGDPQKRKALHTALSSDGYDIGTLDEFSEKMNDPAKVKALYDGISKDGYDVGDFDTFNSKVGPSATLGVPGKPLAPSGNMASPSNLELGSAVSISGSGPITPSVDSAGDGMITPQNTPAPDLIGASRIQQQPDAANFAINPLSVAPEGSEQKKEAEERFAAQDLYDSDYSKLTPEQVSKKKSALPIMRGHVQASERTLDARAKEFQATVSGFEEWNESIKKSEGVIGQDAYNKEVDKYNEAHSRLRREAVGLELEASLVTGMKQKFDVDNLLLKKRETDIASGRGNAATGFVRAFTDQVGAVLAGTTEMSSPVLRHLTDESIMDLFGVLPEGSKKLSKKEFNEQALPYVRNWLTSNSGIDRLVSKEYVDSKKDNSLFYGGMYAVAEMIPGIAASMTPAGAPAMAGSFFFSSYDQLGQEMSDPIWDDVDDAEKEAIRTGISLVSAGLSTMGMQAVAGKMPIVKDIWFRAARKLLPGMSPGVIRQVIDSETKSYVANVASQMAQGFVAEGIEESLDYTQEEGFKAAYENYKETEFGERADALFNNVETIKQYRDGLLNSFVIGGIAGDIVGGSIAAVSSIGARGRLTEKEFDVFRNILASGELKSQFEVNAKVALEDGKMSQSEYDKLNANIEVAQSAINQIPEDMAVEPSRKAFDLLMEKAKLKKLDKSLVGDKVAAIDEQLSALAGVPKPKVEDGISSKPATTSRGVAEKLTFGEKRDKAKKEALYDAVGNTTAAPVVPVLEFSPSDNLLKSRTVQAAGDIQVSDGGAVSGVKIMGPGVERPTGNTEQTVKKEDGDSKPESTDREVRDDNGPSESNVSSGLGAVPERRSEDVGDSGNNAIPTNEDVGGVREEEAAIQAPPSVQDEVPGPEEPRLTPSGFTEASVINRDYKKLKESLGDKGAKKYFDQVDRLFNPNNTKVVEYRENGVVTEASDGTQTFHGLADMDAKKWRVSFSREVEVTAESGADTKALRDEYKENERLLRNARALPVGVISYTEQQRARIDALESRNKEIYPVAFAKEVVAEKAQKEASEKELEEKRDAIRKMRESGIASAPVYQKRNGYEIVKYNEVYHLRDPETKESIHNGTLKRVREVADEIDPFSPSPKEQFQVDDTLILTSPDGKSSGEVSFRGIEGDKAIVWTGRMQMSVDPAQLSKPPTTPKEVAAATDKAPEGEKTPTPKTPKKESKGLTDATKKHKDIKEIDDALGLNDGPMEQRSGPLTSNELANREELMPADQLDWTIDKFVERGLSDKAHDAVIEDIKERIKEARAETTVTNVPSALKRALSNAKEEWNDVKGESLGADEVEHYKAVISSLKEMVSMADDADVRAVVRTLAPRTERGVRVIDINEQRPSDKAPQKTGKLRTDRVVKALSDIAPGIQIHTPATPKEFAAATKHISDGVASSWGVYDPRTNEIFINPEAPDLKQTLFHEAAHPIIIALAKNNPELFTKFHDEVMAHPAAQKYRDHAAKYSDQSEAMQMAEALAEFMGDVAAGRINVSTKPDSLYQKFKAFLQDVLAKLGWDTRSIDLSKPDNIRAFASEFKKAMEKGIKVNGFDPVGGQGDAMEQRKSPKEVASMFKKNGYNNLMAREYMSERNWPQEYADAIAKELEEEPVKPAEKKEPISEVKNTASKMAEHATVRRLKEMHPDIYAAIKSGKYEVLPNSVSIEVADAMVKTLGNAEAQLAVLNKKNGIPGAVRVFMGRMIARDLEQQKEYDKAAEFTEIFMDKILKDFGQGIQAMRDMPEFFSPSMVFARAKRINEEINKKNKSNSKRSRKKLKKKLDVVDKEVIEQVIGGSKVGGKASKAAQPQQKPNGTSQVKKAFRGENNKIVKRSDLSGLWAEARSYMSVGPTNPAHIKIAAFYIEAGARGFAAIAEEVSKELGNKAVPYFKEAYKSAFKYLKDNGVDVGEPDTDQQINDVITKLNTQDLVEQLKKALAKNDQKKSSEILSQLQEQAKGMDAWGAYRDYAVNRVKRMADQEIADARDSSDEMRAFTDGLVRNMTAQMREESDAQGVEPKKRTKPKTDIELIGEAFRNFEKYEQVWKDVQSEWKRRLNAAKARLEKAETPEAKKKAEEDVSREQYRLEKLDAYFGDLLAKPFSEAGIGRAVRKGLKDLGANINDIIRSHYTVQDNTRRSLQQKLIQDAGLTEPEATELAKAVGEEFDRLASQRKREILDQFISRSKKAKEAKALRDKGEGPRSKYKSPEDKFMELANAGALTDDQFAEHYGEMMGWPKVTPEQIEGMRSLADKVQEAPDGRPRVEATEDLMKYMGNIAGTSGWDIAQSLWYANTLSGFQTQEVNFIANSFQLGAEIGTALSKTLVRGRPREAAMIIKALGYGLRVGGIEARSTLSTGYSPIRGKVEMPALFERYDFKKLMAGQYDLNPANYLKFVRRVMVAADTLFYEANKEMRAQQFAMKEARTLYPSQDAKQKALDLMNRGDQAVSEAQIQAGEEYIKDAEAINSDASLTSRQKEAELGRAEFNRKRRVFELVELGRPESIRDESARFAARATYNYTPVGTLGVAANMINGAIKEIPILRYLIPFVNVIANVANENLNFTPIGYLRAYRDGQVSNFRRESLTPSQMEEVKADQIAKATIGLLFATAAFIASGGGDDDDPWMEITANGYGSWTRNKELASETGWQEYSVRFRGSKTWMSYQYTPLMSILSMVGHHNDAKKYREARIDDNYMTAWSIAAARGVASFSDMTMLGSMQDLLRAMGNETAEDVTGGLAKGMSRIVKNFVPYSALLTQTARGVEAMNEQPLKDVRNDAWGYLVQDVPVLRDALHDQLNWLGEPILPEGGYLPRFLSTQKSNPIADLLTKNVYTPSVPQAGSLSAYDPSVDKERYFTKEEQYEFYKERGAYIKMKMEKHMDELKTLDKEDFADEMGKIGQKATIHSKGTIVIHVNKTKQHKAFYYFPVKK